MPYVDIVLPVHNDCDILKRSFFILYDFLSIHCRYEWQITIAENGSTDGTLEVAKEIAEHHQGIRYLHSSQSGRGRALKKAWLSSEADILCYMDIDLSTSLASFVPMIDLIAYKDVHIVVGSRHLKNSHCDRSIQREILSRGYNFLIWLIFLNRKFTDAQCGFKAISRNCARSLLPLVKDNGWFFDTELLLLAQKYNFRIAEIPVLWTEGKSSSVRIITTAIRDFFGLLRMKFS